MTILAHAPVPVECRLDSADTQSLALPIAHPLWCSGQDCLMSTGELFHTRGLAELDVMDGELLDTPAAVDVDLESIDNPSEDRWGVPELFVSVTALGGETHRIRFTPQQAVALAAALTAGARLLGATGDGA